MEVRRVRLVLEYDGTAYAGFQRQPGQRTVQGELEARLSRLVKYPVRVVGAGRTDAGVHSVGQVIHFEDRGEIPVERLGAVLNRLSSPKWRVRDVEEAGPEFHARFGAVRRTYDYFLCLETPTPAWGRYVVGVSGLDGTRVERMRRVLPAFVGRHDFRGFAAAGVDGSTVRCVQDARLDEKQALLRLRLTADGFLWSMVRNITGALLEVGLGRVSVEEIEAALVSGRRLPKVRPAPAHGLFLSRVEYADGYPPSPSPDPFGAFDARDHAPVGGRNEFDENLHGKTGRDPA